MKKEINPAVGIVAAVVTVVVVLLAMYRTVIAPPRVYTTAKDAPWANDPNYRPGPPPGSGFASGN